jgi:SecD/SecF fusion protein
MRRFYWKIALCLGLIAVSALLVGRAFWQYETVGTGFKLGVDLVGGTILVYEVDQDKFADARARQEFENNSGKLAVSLKHRIDPADLYNVTVRQVGTWRVEVILPTGGQHQAQLEEDNWKGVIQKVRDHFGVAPEAQIDAPPGDVASLGQQVHDQLLTRGSDVPIGDIDSYIGDNYQQKYLTTEEVQRVKEKISQVGSLEFEILANNNDDKKALDLAEAYLKRAQEDPKGPEAEALRQANGAEKPPPAPLDKDNPLIETATGLGAYTYSWVELGRSYRYDLHLDNASEGTPTVADGKTQYELSLGGANETQRHLLWHQLAVARGDEKEIKNGAGDGKWIFEKVPDADPGPGVAPDKAVAPYLLYNQTTILCSRRVVNPSLLKSDDRGKQVEYFQLVRNPKPGTEVTGLYLISAFATTGKNMGPAVGFHFNQTGGDRFYELTSKNAPTPQGFHRQLAIILDGMIVTAPSLNARISTEGIIEGHFTADEVTRYVNILNSGALPASLKGTPVSENTIGPTLGQDTITKGFWSVIWAFVVVLGFMAIYYRFSGLVACIALFANLLLTVAFMVLVQATFTLPGLAGLVLMLGMAVDANVLIYERLREERDRGATLALAIRNGYDRAFPTIIDTHLSSIFTAIVLYAVGNDQLKGFGISLTVGLIISLFTSLVMTRLMFDVALATGRLTKLGMFRLLSRTNIDFMAIRYYWFTATILLTVLGASVFFLRGRSALNIDFVGGTAYTGQLTHPMTLVSSPDKPGLRDLLGEKKQESMLVVTNVKRLDDRGMEFEITYKDDPQPWRINLPNPATEDDIRARARKLPDLSVEQIYLSSAATAGEGSDQKKEEGSRLFTVRTSEKAPELVQAEISRLLGDNLKKIGLKAQAGGALWTDPRGANVNLIFTDATTHEPAALSLSEQVRPQVESAFKDLVPSVEGAGDKVTLKFRTEAARSMVGNVAAALRAGLKTQPDGHPVDVTVTARDQEPQVVDLAFTDTMTKEPATVPVDQVRPAVESAFPPPQVDALDEATGGKTSRVALKLRKDLTQAALDQVIAALQAGLKTQPDNHAVLVASGYTQAKLEFVDLSVDTRPPAFASPGQVTMLLDRELQTLSLSTRRFSLEGEGAQENGRYQTMILKLNEPLDRVTLAQVLEKTQKEFSSRPQPERLENFDSQLAEETQTRALYAILASWAAILLYLWFRFGNWTFGAAAVLCLIHDLFFTLGIIAFAHWLHDIPFFGSFLLLQDFKIDLPAVAALLTLVGYSVNDTIVVFDRIREVRGKNPELTPKTINDSVNQTLSRTLLTATTVFLVVIVLYIFGGEGVHLFAFVMVVGVIVGTYSSIYIASPLLLIFGEGARTAPVREREPAGVR